MYLYAYRLLLLAQLVAEPFSPQVQEVRWLQALEVEVVLLLLVVVV
jgi:hypothetical protein